MKSKVIELLKEYTGHENVVVTRRGNVAIRAALRMVEGSVLIPDQGVWMTYVQHAEKLKMPIIELSTTDGKIDLDALKRQVDDAGCIIYQHPGGYFASQPVKEIYDICAGKCIVIVDVTGCLGSIDGQYGDIFVCSFAEGKQVDAGVGGFISSKELPLVAEEIEDGDYSVILPKLEQAPARLKQLHAVCREIKTDLKARDVVYPDDDSLVVVVRYSTEGEKQGIEEYCHSKGFEFTECPRKIRLDDQAISIEVKRIQNFK